MGIGFMRGNGMGDAKKEIESNKNLSVMSRSFPMLIKRCRAYLKVTQGDFARLVGVSTSAVRAWEQGKQLPNFENFQTISSMVRLSGFSQELENAYIEQKGQ